MGLSVGLDVGAHHVRAIAVRPGKGGLRIVAHGTVPRFAEDGTERSLTTVVAELAELLPLSRPAAASVTDIEVLARFISVAPLPPARLHRLLRLELAPDEGQPIPAMDAIRLAVGGDDLFFLGLIAETGAVKLAQNELLRAGVRPGSVSWGPVALAATASRMTFNDERLVLAVDIGVNGTDVALVGEGRLLACRRLAVGGELFTQALLDAGLTHQQAEQAKLAGSWARSPQPADPGLDLSAPAQSDSLDLTFEDPVASEPAQPGQAVDPSAADDLGPQLTRPAEMLYGQLATTITFFKAQLKRSELPVGRVLLCGGGAGLRGLDGYLSRRFQAPVERLDPFTVCTGDDLPSEPWRWARAVGLALAGCADVPRADLRPEAELRAEAWRRRLAWPFVAAGLLLVAGAGLGYDLSERVDRDRREAELLERAVAEHRKLSEELASLDAERNALGEDLRAIAGRIHAARDLLYTVKLLKEQTQTSRELWITSLETVGIGRSDGGGDDASGAAPAASSGRLLGSGKAAARHDSLIDRGAVDIAGRVRFDVKKSDPELVAFREDYQKALQTWKTPEGTTLFREVKLTNTNLVHFEKPKAGDGGEFPFRFRCKFQATSLEAGSEPAVAPQSEPQADPAPPAQPRRMQSGGTP
jgi:hypothetical protein